MLVLASILFTISPHAYRFLRNSGVVILPHPSTVKRVCGRHDVSSLQEQSEDGFLRYVIRRASSLKSQERNVTLMVDEIHLQQYFEYKGGCVTGSASNSAEPAKTAHVFMVQSLLSSYKDVVHVLPVSRITAEELHDVLNKIIIGLEDAGIHVVAVITDNNSINRKIMAMFGKKKRCQLGYRIPTSCECTAAVVSCC